MGFSLLYCIPAVIVTIAVVVLSLRGKDRFDEHIEALDDKDYPLKRYMAMGFAMDEVFPISQRFNSSPGAIGTYFSKVNSQLAEIYNGNYLQFYRSAHDAARWTLTLVVAELFMVFTAALGLKRDSETALQLLVLGLFISIVCFFMGDNQLASKCEKRQLAIQLDFPDFVSKLLLLVGAGLTISRAWEKIVEDTDKQTPLYQELRYTQARIKAGTPEAVAYEEFGRNCRVKEIVRFVAVMVINLRKGGPEAVVAMQAQGNECWELRKTAARRLGEEASSKLMMPIAMMLIGVMLIAVTPAVFMITSAT